VPRFYERHGLCFQERKQIRQGDSNGESKDPSRGEDAITLLKEDHETIRKLLGELAETSVKPSRRREEHVADTVLGELKEAEPVSEAFAAKAKVLKGLVEHHAEDEETEMFPRARKLMSRAELRELHERLADTKTALTEGVLTKLVELVRPS